MRYKILHNPNDLDSRNFVQSYSSMGDVIDFYNESQRASYLESGGVTPGAFPSVFDSEEGVISSKVSTFQDGVDQCSELAAAFSPDYRAKRMKEYLENGLTAEAWALAMLDVQADGDSTRFNAMSAKRQEIKQKYPKPQS